MDILNKITGSIADWGTSDKTDGASVWNKVMNTAMDIPGVRVDRDEFLDEVLEQYCEPEKLELIKTENPVRYLSSNVINEVANATINVHTTKVTTLSAVSGIPGGLAMLGTIPLDLAQYYWHVFVLAQKLSYLYGFPDICDEEGNLTEASTEMLTVFVGVMLGAATANQAIKNISEQLAKQAVRKISQTALTKTTAYPIIKQVGKYIGITITKKALQSGVSKAIPVIGGVISGGLTFATFRPSAKRLQKKLSEDMDVFGNCDQITTEDKTTKPDIIDADIEEINISPKQMSIMMLINAAKVDHVVTDEERNYLDSTIENSGLDEDTQLMLASSYNTKELFDIDYSVFEDNIPLLEDTLAKIKEIAESDGQVSLAEKIYIKKIEKELTE